MKKTYLKSSPHFFRLIRRAFWGALLLLLVAALLVPAPLQQPASPAMVPNPAKSAWFLLWIQELVSYGVWLVYPLLLAGLLFTLLPWLQRRSAEHAAWFGPQHRLAAGAVVMLFVVVCLLTLVGFYCRGENWAFIMPF